MPAAPPARRRRAPAALGRDHVARREPLLVAPVLAQRHQLGLARTAAITWSNCSLPSECRNANSQGRGVNVACCRVMASSATRIGDDLLAILARDARMILDPLGLKPLGRRDAAGPILCCGSSSMPCAS
jgi:hypothetical protein